MALADYYNKVQAYFVASLGRPASSAELAQYAGALEANNGNVWKAGLVTYIQAQPDFSSDVATVYKNLTGAEPTMAIYNYYTGKMLAGEIKAKGLANAMINDLGFMPKADGTYGAPANWAVNLAADAGATDLTGVQNKITVANTFTSSLDSVAEATSYATAAGKESAKALLAGVTADADTVTTATANVDTTVANIVTEATTTSAVGQTFTLTTSANTGADFTGGTGDDVFNGSAGTIDGDVLAGNAGNDTLNLTVTIADDDQSAFTASGIETINLRSTGGTANDAALIDLEMGDVSGATNIVFKRINDDMNLTNVQSLSTTLTLESNATAADVTVNYDAAVVTGTTDTVNVTVDGTTGGADLVVNGVETIAVTAVGTGNDLNIDGDDLTTVTVAGSGSINMDVDASVTTFNASAATGAVTVNTTAAADVAITGGAGNDVLNLGTRLTNDDTIDGGAGTDTLNITAFATVAGETYSSTNVEVLRLESASVTTEVDQFSGTAGFTTVRVDVLAGGHSLVLNDIANTSAVLVTNNTAGTDATLTALTMTYASDTGTADAQTVTLTVDGDDGDDAGLTVTTLSVDEIETVTLNLNANSVNSIAVATITANEIDTLNITGAAEATLGGTTAMTIETINASTATGNLTLNMGAAAHTVTGGTGDDTFAFGANLATTDSVVGGAGNDTLTAAMAAGTAAATISGVESATLEFDTAGATFSGANASTGLTSIATAAATAEATSLTAIKSAVATVRLGSTATDASDNATIAYASGSNAAHTVVIGDSTATPAALVTLGDITISGNAGALTISSDAFAGNIVDTITANTATSLTISTTESLELDDTAGADGNLSATAATAVTITTAGGALVVDGTQNFANATAITLNGNDGNLTLTGAMAATDATTLTVTSAAGVAVEQTGNFTSDADVTTVSMTATGASSTIRYNGILDVDHVRTINLTAATGGAVTVDDIEMLGVDTDGDDVTTAINISATGTDAADNGSTVTVSAINTAAAATLDSVVITSDADGTVSFTTGAGNLTITEIDASASAGDLTIDASTLAAATEITTGSGENSITTDNGFADTITLASAAGDDTINVTADNGGTSAADVITNFQAGASGDVLSLTVANLDGASAGEAVNGSNTALSAALAVNIQTDADGTFALAANTNIVRLTDTFVDVAAVVAAMSVTTAGNITDDTDLLVLWTNGASTFLSRLEVNDATAASPIAAFDGAENLVELVGTTVSDLTAANFAFV